MIEVFLASDSLRACVILDGQQRVCQGVTNV